MAENSNPTNTIDERVLTEGPYFVVTDPTSQDAEIHVGTCTKYVERAQSGWALEVVDLVSTGDGWICKCIDLESRTFGVAFDTVGAPAGAGGATGSAKAKGTKASEKQIAFIESLVSQKGEAGQAQLAGKLAEWETTLDELTKAQAKDLIDLLMTLTEVLDTERTLTTDEVIDLAESLGRKFEVDDVTDELRVFATEWAKDYSGDFAYMLDMKSAAATKVLSAGQAKGTLNCFRAGINRGEVVRSTATNEPSDEVTEAGMYRTPEGVIYKVQESRESGRLYAKRLVELDEPEVMKTKTKTHEFEYEAGAVRKLRASMAMSLDEAKEFGQLYGTCCVCGALLTNEASIEAGIGPVCAERF